MREFRKLTRYLLVLKKPNDCCFNFHVIAIETFYTQKAINLVRNTFYSLTNVRTSLARRWGIWSLLAYITSNKRIQMAYVVHFTSTSYVVVIYTQPYVKLGHVRLIIVFRTYSYTYSYVTLMCILFCLLHVQLRFCGAKCFPIFGTLFMTISLTASLGNVLRLPGTVFLHGGGK